VARASKVEKRACAVCVELARVTASSPMQWRMVAPIVMAAGLNEAAAADSLIELRKLWDWIPDRIQLHRAH
jgi:hypothetical protein